MYAWKVPVSEFKCLKHLGDSKIRWLLDLKAMLTHTEYTETCYMLYYAYCSMICEVYDIKPNCDDRKQNPLIILFLSVCYDSWTSSQAEVVEIIWKSIFIKESLCKKGDFCQ